MTRLSVAILILLSFHSVCVRVPHLHFLVTHVTEANDLLKEQSLAPKVFFTFRDPGFCRSTDVFARGPKRVAPPEKHLPGTLAL